MRGLRLILKLSTRLAFIATLWLWANSRCMGQAPTYDLLLKGGHVIDPANNVDAVMDVAVDQRQNCRRRKRHSRQPGKEGRGRFRALCHARAHRYSRPYRPWRRAARLVHPRGPCPSYPLRDPGRYWRLQSGVTTIVDAGTSGAETFLLEKEEVIDRAKVRVLAFLEHRGQWHAGRPGAVRGPDGCQALRRHHQEISRPHRGRENGALLDRGPWDGEHTPWAAVDSAIDAAESRSTCR